MSNRKGRRQRAREAQQPGAVVQPKPRLPLTAVLIPTILIAAGLCALNLAIYSDVTQHQFIDLDDAAYVYQNPNVTHGLSWQSAAWAFRTIYQSYWHPLTWLSHMLDVQLFGLDAGWHHAVSVLIHLLSTLLLFAWLYRMTGTLGRSAFVAALFASHPLHVESVAWAAERKDVLSTLFWMSTILVYGWYVRKPGAARYALVAGLFALGLMSKPMLVTAPFTLLLLDYWPLARMAEGFRAALPKLVLEKVPLLALSAASSVITWIAQKQAGALTGIGALPLAPRIAHATVAYAVYLRKTLWPSDLAAFYHYSASLPAWTVAGSALLLIAVSALVVWAGRAHPYLPVGWLWFLGTLVPVIGLVQVGQQSYADRYMYVPLIGLAIIASWGGYEALSRVSLQSAAPWAAGALILVLTLVAWKQVSYWRTSYTLWSHALEVTSDNEIAETGVGTVLFLSGRPANAIPYLVRAVRIKPDYPEARVTLARALLQQGKVDQAIAEDRVAVQVKPSYAVAHGSLGLALLRGGKTKEAAEQFREALTLDPNNRDAREGMGLLVSK